MKTLKIFLFSLMLFLTLSTGVKAEFFKDIIVTGPSGIWTDARAYSTLNAAITAVGANQRTVVIASPQTVAALTVPANITLKFERDGAIVNSGQLTINGDVIAGLHTIFSGAGAVTLSAVENIYPAWWGLSEVAIGSVNSAAIQAAIVAASVPSTSQNYPLHPGAKVMLHRGTFAVAPDIISFTGRRGVTLSGVSSGYGYIDTNSGTILKFSTGSIGINMYQAANSDQSGNNKVSNLTIDGSAVLTTGIKVTFNQILEDIGVTHCKDYGIWLADGTNSTVLNRVSAMSNTTGLGYGLYVSGPMTTIFTVKDSNFRINKVGIRLECFSNPLFQNVVSESNTAEGLYIYRAYDGAVTSGGFGNGAVFDGIWLENNYLGGSGYGLVIDGVTRNNGQGVPQGLEFNRGNITVTGVAKHLNILGAVGVKFKDMTIAGGAAGEIALNTDRARYIVFEGCTLASFAGGNYGYRGGAVGKVLTGTLYNSDLGLGIADDGQFLVPVTTLTTATPTTIASFDSNTSTYNIAGFVDLMVYDKVATTGKYILYRVAFGSNWGLQNTVGVFSNTSTSTWSVDIISSHIGSNAVGLALTFNVVGSASQFYLSVTQSSGATAYIKGVGTVFHAR